MGYQTSVPQASREALQKARANIESQYANPNSSTQAHSVGIGIVKKGGEDVIGPDGKPVAGIIVTVGVKADRAELPPSEYIPPTVQVNTDDDKTPPVETVLVDVQVAPMPSPKLLKLGEYDSFATAQAISEWRACFNAPIPGGVQIAPEGANWVGTLGCALRQKNRRYGALTNYHVGSVREQLGIQMRQPSSQGRPFGRVAELSRMDFSQNGSNRHDVCIIDTWMDEGPYAPGCHTVKPEQFKIGRLNPEWVSRAAQRLGDFVQKSGRTTGHMKGRITQIDMTTFVSYDNGTARFINQIGIEAGGGGNFSAGGDSGSLIVTDDVRPSCLLFAGGGNLTIASPIQFVVEDFGVSFF